MESEKWMPVLDFENIYEVSNLGRVKRVLNYNNLVGLVKPSLCTNGYMKVNLSKQNRRKQLQLHRVVIEAFHGRIQPGMVVNHLDFDKINNCLSNLKVGTQSDNIRHTILNGKHAGFLKPEKVQEIRETYARLKSQRKVAILMGVSKSTVSAIVSGRSWNYLH